MPKKGYFAYEKQEKPCEPQKATAEPISIREPDTQYRSMVKPPPPMSFSLSVSDSAIPLTLMSATCLF
jgi:hypothetical protein